MSSSKKQPESEGRKFFTYHETFILPYNLQNVALGSYLVGTNTFFWSIVEVLGGDLTPHSFRHVSAFLSYTFGLRNFPWKGIKVLVIMARGKMYDPKIPFLCYLFAIRKFKWKKEKITPTKVQKLAQEIFYGGMSYDASQI